MTAALRFTPFGATNAHDTSTIRYDASNVRFKLVGPQPPPRTVFAMNHDESGWTGMNLGVSDTRFTQKAHE